MPEEPTTLVQRIEALATEVQRQIAASPAHRNVSASEKMLIDLRETAGVLVEIRGLLELLAKHGKNDPAIEAQMAEIIDRLDAADPEPVLATDG